MNSQCEAGSKRLGSEMCDGTPEERDKAVRVGPLLPSPRVTHSSALSSGLANKVLVSNVTPFGEKTRGRQFQIKSAIREQIFDLCRDENMNDGEVCDLLQYSKRAVERQARQVNMVNRQDRAIEDALRDRSLKERNQLIRLMTHTAGGQLNEAMLQVFPSLRPRSVELHTAVDRKTREDKIDTKFIVDFMHSICRYSF